MIKSYAIKIKSYFSNKIKSTNWKLFLKNTVFLFILIFLSLLLHILAINELGFEYTIESDDQTYLNTGISFAQTGEIITAQIMPGMPMLVALFTLLFGTKLSLIVALKILWMIMSTISIIFLYKTISIYAKPIFSFLASLFLLAADFIWMDNIILTETPFMMAFILLVYHSLKLAKNPNKFDYIMIIVWFVFALFMRPVIAIYPIFLVIYLLLKKYNVKLLIKQLCIAAIIILLLLAPWIYKNYQLYDRFIPFTYGTGNPLLLGTYQGVGYPKDKSLDYKKNVDFKMSDEMKLYVKGKPKKDLHLKKYYELEYDSLKAKYRMQQWWKTDKISMIKSYTIYKPKELIYSSFYWKEIFGIPAQTNLLLRKIDLLLFAISSIAIFINRKRLKEYLFLMMVYISQICIYAYTFAFSRYAITLYFLRFIIIGWGLSIIYEAIKKKISDKKVNTNI